MKTTIEVAEGLMAEARRVARRERTTLRALVEEGLRAALEKRRERTRFKLRDASFRGKGLQPGISAGSWERIREVIYQGRGA